MSSLRRRDDRHHAPPLSTAVDPALPALTRTDAPAVALQHVTVPGGSQRDRLRDIDLAIAAGEHWGVLGANGSGKSTLLDVIRGRLAPATGTVRILGERLGAVGFSDPGLRIGVVASAPRFSQGLIALDVVLLRSAGPAALRGTRISDAEVARARRLLAQLGCGELADRPYAECSQGQRQRINLARALLREPAILLLDEPTSALDLPGRAAFLQAMLGVARARPELTTVIVTHHVEELPASTTHVAVLDAGRLAAAGPAGEVLTGETLSRCFGVEIAVAEHDGGWSARVRRPRW